MPDVHRRIDECIETFTADMGRIVRRVAFDSVSHALTTEPADAPKNATSALRAARRPNAKRTRDQIDRTTAALESHIRRTPGRRMEQLTGELGLSSRELSLPVRRLLEAGRVRTEGQKRATRYYPA